MGLKCSPDYVQEVMENIFRDVTDAEVYIDDIGAFSNSWEQHIALLHIILGKLQENGFTVNYRQCYIVFVKELYINKKIDIFQIDICMFLRYKNNILNFETFYINK